MRDLRLALCLTAVIGCGHCLGCSSTAPRLAVPPRAAQLAQIQPPLADRSAAAGELPPERDEDPSAGQQESVARAAAPTQFASLEGSLPTPRQTLVAATGVASSTGALQADRPTAADGNLPFPGKTGSFSVAADTDSGLAPQQSVIQELDLAQALAMAGGENPRIAFAAARYREAYAQWSAARVLWLPSLRGGASFNHHDGPLQASSGVIDDVSRSALQAGLGVQAIGAGSPIVPGVVAQFHAADAIFQPRITANTVHARSAATRAATNDTLLTTALAYLELLRATQDLRIAEQTLENARQLADLSRSFAETGQGPQADADRTQTELLGRRNDVSRAEEAMLVAGARLAEQLSLGADLLILPSESTIVPVELVSSETSFQELVATALSNRPELAEAQHLVCEAVERYRRERYAPLVPSVLLGISDSGFGGGLGSTVDDFGNRFDLDAVAFWELRNLGFGERARRQEMAARHQQARALQVRIMDRVAREVAEAGTQIRARKSQMAVAQEAIQAATASYDRNLARIREGQGLPIEVLQSLQALDEAQREYLRAVVDYNEAQFSLQRALGWPIQ